MCVRVRSLLFRKSLVKFIIFIVWRCIECVLSAWTFYSNTQSRRSAMFFRCWLLCPASMLIFKTVDSVKNFNISIIKNENGITKLWSHLNGAVNGLFLPLALSPIYPGSLFSFCMPILPSLEAALSLDFSYFSRFIPRIFSHFAWEFGYKFRDLNLS